MHDSNLPGAVVEQPRSFYDEPISDLRIVGGEAVIANSYRWMCSIQTSPNGSHFCGGSLIGAQHILCAKHCLRMSKTPYVLVGGINLRNPNEFVQRRVAAVHEHPTTDVCIMVLDSPIKEIEPVKVNSNENLTPGSDVIAIGFGRTGESAPPSPVLMQVTLKLQNQTTCVKINGASKFNLRYELCAGVVDQGGKDACAGDSGGPLIINGSPAAGQAAQVLIGVTSYGVGCARKGKAGVWVRTSAIKDWIASLVPDAQFADASAQFLHPAPEPQPRQPAQAPSQTQPQQTQQVQQQQQPQVIQVQLLQPVQFVSDGQDSVQKYFSYYQSPEPIYRSINLEDKQKPLQPGIDTWPLIIVFGGIFLGVLATVYFRQTSGTFSA